MQYIALSNHITMPQEEYGVFQIPDNTWCVHCVSSALEVGYRPIDAVFSYPNEVGVVRVIKSSAIVKNFLLPPSYG